MRFCLWINIIVLLWPTKRKKSGYFISHIEKSFFFFFFYQRTISTTSSFCINAYEHPENVVPVKNINKMITNTHSLKEKIIFLLLPKSMPITTG
jgi:hypothetical protein